MDRDGITYFSLMTQEPERIHGDRHRRQEGVRLTFRSSADYWGESLSFGLGKNLHPVIGIQTSGRFQSLARVPDEQSLLWIGKIIRRADGEDEITFRIYGQKFSRFFCQVKQNCPRFKYWKIIVIFIYNCGNASIRIDGRKLRLFLLIG